MPDLVSLTGLTGWRHSEAAMSRSEGTDERVGSSRPTTTQLLLLLTIGALSSASEGMSSTEKAKTRRTSLSEDFAAVRPDRLIGICERRDGHAVVLAHVVIEHCRGLEAERLQARRGGAERVGRDVDEDRLGEDAQGLVDELHEVLGQRSLGPDLVGLEDGGSEPTRAWSAHEDASKDLPLASTTEARADDGHSCTVKCSVELCEMIESCATIVSVRPRRQQR